MQPSSCDGNNCRNPPAVCIGGNLGETSEQLPHRLFWGSARARGRSPATPGSGFAQLLLDRVRAPRSK